MVHEEQPRDPETLDGGRVDALHLGDRDRANGRVGLDYADAGVDVAPGCSAVVASFSLAAALRAFILICLIFGSPSTDCPGAHVPCVRRWRTRSCRFRTLRPEVLASPVDRSDGWIDIGLEGFQETVLITILELNQFFLRIIL